MYRRGAEIGTFSLLSALSGANLLHDVGYLESGLTGSLELIVLGDEVAGLVRAITRDWVPNRTISQWM